MDHSEDFDDEPPWAQTWDTHEMESYLAKGLCDKVETTERIGIHPYWLRNVVIGAMEELRGYLGKWSKEFKGYLLGFERPLQVRADSKQGDFPHPYIYYNFKVVRYIYRPANGQTLQGEVTNFGEKAASCLVFSTFMATVHPRTNDEFNSWNIGDKVDFVVERFDQLRNCVMLEGTSIDSVDFGEEGEEQLQLPKKKSSKIKLKHKESLNSSKTFSDAEEPLPSTTVIESMEYEEQEPEFEPPKKKRKKSKSDKLEKIPRGKAMEV